MSASPITCNRQRKRCATGNLNVLKADLDRAKLLGMNAYRFSIEWSRVQPTQATFDQAALQYYDDAINEMLVRGLKPIVTLNHLTLPSWVLTPPQSSAPTGVAAEDDDFRASLRGWESQQTVDAFITYVNVVVGRYKDRVDIWITLNEPVGSMIGIGYIGGIWPPGFSLDGNRAKTAYFNLLRALAGRNCPCHAVCQAHPRWWGHRQYQ